MPKVKKLENSGVDRDELGGAEKELLRASIQRAFEDTRALDTKVLLEKLQQYQEQIKFAAGAAKHDLSGSFDGHSPDSGNFGVDVIHPGYFGYDSWDDMPDVTGGQTFNWIDSHTPTNLNSGSTGDSFTDPLQIGEPVTHLILGFGSYEPDPKTNRIKVEKNDNPETAVTTENFYRGTDTKLAWLNTPLLLQPQDEFAAMGFAGGEQSQTYSEALYPFGLTFIEARDFRTLDPSVMAGTDSSNIVVER